MSVLRSRLFFSKSLGDFYPRRPFKRLCAGASIFVIAMLTAGCTESILGYNGVNSQVNLNAPPPAQEAPGLGVHDLAVPPTDNRGGAYGSLNYSRSRSTVYPGTDTVSVSADHGQASSAGMRADAADQAAASPNGGYQLNFENADVATVAKVIFGDILKTNYIVDSRVTGQISLSSSAPVPNSRLVPLLEAALLSANASVVKEPDGYRIAPTADPGGLREAQYDAVGVGYGVTVIGSKYVSAASIARLLEEYGSRAGTVKLDTAANLVVVQGTAEERQAALDAASMLDVDWLRSKSVAILTLRNATPDQMIPELNRILDTGHSGESADMVQLQPLAGLNAVLAVSRSRAMLDQVVVWSRRLDQQDYSAMSLQTYRLRYAQAKTVASVLNSMFGGNGGGGQSDKDQLAPGGQGNSTSQASGYSSSSGSPMSGGTSGAASPPPGGGGAAPGQSASSGPTTATSGVGGSSSNPFGALGTSADEGSTGGGIQTAPNGSKVHVTADVASNTLFIYSDKQTYEKIERAIMEIDRAPTQIDVDVTIAEVTLNKDLQYGVQVYLNGGSGLGALTMTNGSQAAAQAASSASGTAVTPTVASVQPGIPLTTLNPGVNLLAGAIANPRVVIDALSQVTDVKVLSSPSLVVGDRQPARLEVGDQVPVLSQQAVSTETAGAPVVNSVSYVNTGIILNVIPSVNADGIVSLQVQQEISSVTNPGTASNPNLTPTISQRTVHSNVSVPSGQTVLLAGLIQDQRTETRSGLPGVGDIPLVSQLLTNHDSNVQRDELIVFIRPRIIHNSYDAEAVSEEFRSRLQSMQPQLVDRYLRKP
jgi:general secretion pathway protein D